MFHNCFLSVCFHCSHYYHLLAATGCCCWKLLLPRIPFLKQSVSWFHRCVSVSLTNTGTCQAEKAFPGCLCTLWMNLRSLMVNWWEMSVRDKLPLTFCYGRAYMFQRDNAKWHAVSIKTARLYNKRRRCIGCLNRFSLPKVQQRVSDVPRHLWTQSCCSFLCNSQTQLCKRHSSNRKLHHTCQNMRQSLQLMNDWKPFTTILRHWNDFYFFRSITLFCSYFIIQSLNI